MENYLECPKCSSGWEIAKNEHFCGFCGEKKINYELGAATPGERLVYFKNGEEHRFDLKLKNKGLDTLTVNRISIREN